MRNMLRTLIALVYLVSATLAQAGFVINPFVFAAPAMPVVAEWTTGGCNSSSGAGPVITATARAIGTAAADRYVVVGVVAEDNATAFSATTATVDGTATTKLVESATTGALVYTALWITNAPFTTGTTADLEVTFSEALSGGSAICAWSVTGPLNSTTPVTTANDFETASAPMTLDMTTVADGAAIFMCGADGPTSVQAATGFTERFDNVLATTVGRYAGGVFNEDATAGATTFTSDFSNTGDSACSAVFLR